VAAAALIVATHLAVKLDHRMATAALARQRAFAASEYALWGAVAAWDGSSSGLPQGSATVKVVHAAGDSAILTTFRLNEQMYWLVAEATVGDARRRTGLNVLTLTDSTGTQVRAVKRSWVDLY
jgi:hypothetical protein